MNVHDQARRLMAQSPTPLTLSEAYSRLARRGVAKRRRAKYGATTVQPGAFSHVEVPANYQPLYADNDYP